MRCQKVGKYLKKSAFHEEIKEGNIFGICVFFDFSPNRKILSICGSLVVEEMVSESFDSR